MRQFEDQIAQLLGERPTVPADATAVRKPIVATKPEPAMSSKEACPVCAGSSFTIHTDALVFKNTKGEEFHYSAEYSKCDQCGEEFYSRQQTRAASRAAVAAERRRHNRLAPSEIEAIRKLYFATQEEAEAVLGFGKKSFSRWETGRVCPSHAADHLLREVRSSPSMVARMAAQAGVALKSFNSSWEAWQPSSYAGIATVVLPATTEVTVRRRPGPQQQAEVEPADDRRAVPASAGHGIGVSIDARDDGGRTRMDGGRLA